jgi:hypothetical protein
VINGSEIRGYKNIEMVIGGAYVAAGDWSGDFALFVWEPNQRPTDGLGHRKEG